MKLMNIGFGNCVNVDRIVAIVSPDSAPIKRIVQGSKEKGTLIDVILSYLQPETLKSRLQDEEGEEASER